MAATRCAVFVFNSVYCIPLLDSSMDRVDGMVAEWFSLDERLIFQSVSKNISLQLNEERKVWDSLETDGGALLSNNIASSFKKTQSSSPITRSCCSCRRSAEFWCRSGGLPLCMSHVVKYHRHLSLAIPADFSAS